MPKKKRLSLQQRIERDAIDKLTVKSMSVGDLANILEENYYTVRKAIKRLEDNGLVTGKHSRNNIIVYSLTDPEKAPPNNSIPKVKGKTGPIKIIALLDSVGKEKGSPSEEAATSLPRNLTRLFMAALRYTSTNGQYDIDRNLKHIRLELELHRAQLAKLLTYYDAVLQAEVFWNPNTIRAIPYDHEFDRDKVIQSYRHYYPED